MAHSTLSKYTAVKAAAFRAAVLRGQAGGTNATPGQDRGCSREQPQQEEQGHGKRSGADAADVPSRPLAARPRAPLPRFPPVFAHLCVQKRRRQQHGRSQQPHPRRVPCSPAMEDTAGRGHHHHMTRRGQRRGRLPVPSAGSREQHGWGAARDGGRGTLGSSPGQRRSLQVHRARDGGSVHCRSQLQPAGTALAPPGAVGGTHRGTRSLAPPDRHNAAEGLSPLARRRSGDGSSLCEGDAALCARDFREASQRWARGGPLPAGRPRHLCPLHH